MTKMKKAKTVAQVSRGKLKEVTGRVVGNDRLAAHGELEQLRGHLKQAGEKFKNAFKK